MRFLIILFPAFLLADGLPLVNFSDDAVFNYFFTLWVYFLFIMLPIIAALSLFRS